ncbi:hypothetical protein [Flavobacterium sp. '19STA2R22 D10 B1']|uniref:hypothetical protein n=1 Tax=Flavobacterium aerium TaxID=3037261 RepID=UPI00278C2E22|nr:hypothetical protein [Flavobacterium sp. '19STA2R22 D10 B1']
MKKSILQLKGVHELSKKTLIKLTGGNSGCESGMIQLVCGGPWIWVPNKCNVKYPLCD